MNHHIAYIALGSNLGESQNTLEQAILAVEQALGLPCLAKSRFYVTAPIDSAGPDYINAVICVCTSLEAMDLLKVLQSIELAFGRERPYRNAPRTLDLDILLYGDEVSDDPVLTLPHPRMYERAFVLHPLAEIAPHLVTGKDLEKVSHQAIMPL